MVSIANNSKPFGLETPGFPENSNAE